MFNYGAKHWCSWFSDILQEGLYIAGARLRLLLLLLHKHVGMFAEVGKMFTLVGAR